MTAAEDFPIANIIDFTMHQLKTLILHLITLNLIRWDAERFV